MHKYYFCNKDLGMRSHIMSCFFLLLLHSISYSQIVNIDKSKTKADKKGLQGDLRLGFNFVHTNTDMTQVSSQVQLQYNDRDNTYLFSSNLGYSQLNDERNVNNGDAMLKYNYWVPDKIIVAEAFYQYGYNRIKQLKHRHILGAGPRFNVANKDKFSLFIVAYTIYLKELFETEEYKRTKSLVKFSSMLSFTWQITRQVKFEHSSYYEPDYSAPSDYRIMSETKFEFDISNTFAFSLYGKFDYDNQVPPGVDPLFYTINNALKIKF